MKNLIFFYFFFVAKLSRNEETTNQIVITCWWRNLIGELAAGVDAEQGRTDLGHQLLSDQLEARFEGVNDLKMI